MEPVEARIKALEARIAALEAAISHPAAPAIDPDVLYPLKTIIDAGWLGSATTAYKLVQRREVPSVALGPSGGCLRVYGRDILDYHKSKTSNASARGRKLTHIK